MSIAKTLRQVLYSACLYFTAAEFVLLTIAAIYQQTNPEAGGTAGMFLSLGSSALIFLACLLMSALNLVFRLDYSISVRMLIHFFGSLVAYAIVFIIIPGVLTDVAQVIVRIIIFAAVYLIIAFIALIIASLRKNKRTESFEYESQFDGFSRKK